MDKQSFRIRFIKTVWRIALILAGSVISGAGISLLLEPHHLLSGGVTGASMLLSYFTPFDPGVWIVAINIPLFIMAWRKIDLHFCIYSIIGMLSLSGAIMVLSNLEIPSLVSNPLLAALFGGMLCGGGTGLVIRARGSHGGTDIVSVIIRQKYSVSIGMVTFYVNLVLVGLLSVKYGIELGLLTIFSQFISARSLDRVVTGLNIAKGITIVSDRPNEIADYIMKRMDRGVTFLEGAGAYGKGDKKVIWCVVTTSQLSRIKGAMKKIDPKAFMAITDASEVVGEGFYRAPF